MNSPSAPAARPTPCKLKRKVELPLYRETLAAYGETKARRGRARRLQGIDTEASEVRLKMAPSALVGLSTSFDSFSIIPTGAPSSSRARTLPLVALADLAKEFGVKLPANVPHVVEDAVEEILKNQRGDGGFGFWADSERSEPWLSAYVALTLDAAKARGSQGVEASPLDSLSSYLRSALSSRIPDSRHVRQQGLDHRRRPSGGAGDPSAASCLPTKGRGWITPTPHSWPTHWPPSVPPTQAT